MRIKQIINVIFLNFKKFSCIHFNKQLVVQKDATFRILKLVANTIMENIKRTIAKTIIYRGSTTVLLFVLSWILTNNVYETSIITILFNVIATGIYFFHERFWSKISWGIVKSPKTSNQLQ